MISRIFRVDNSTSVNSSATDLATLLKEKKASPPPIHDFHYQKKNPYTAGDIPGAGEAKAEFESLLFLGHTGIVDSSFGDSTPEEFADHFDQAFEGPEKSIFRGSRPYQYRDKLHVKHLYLIGCSVGLANQGKNDSYAQHLANRLFERGFTNVQVHAVAYEKQAPGESMCVKLLSRPAVYNQAAEPGYLSAYSLNEETADSLREQWAILEREQGTGTEKGRGAETVMKGIELKLEDTAQITGYVSPLFLLQHVDNTYIPLETYRTRKERLESDVLYVEKQTRKIVIECVQGMERGLQGKKDSQRATLRSLLHELRNNYSYPWPRLCGFSAKNYSGSLNWAGRRFLSASDPILTQLDQLSQGDLTPLPVPEEKLPHPPLANNLKKQKDRSSAAPSSLFFPATTPKTEAAFAKLGNEIEKLQAALDDEISQLSDRAANSSCPSPFLAFEIATKRRKLARLDDLLKATTPADLRACAQTALGETRVTWSFRNSCSREWGTSRTQTLLRNIVESTAQQMEGKDVPSRKKK